MKKVVLIVLAVVVLLGIVLVGNLVSGYNNLVKMNEQVENSWAQVENQLQRRNDLIPNLVETVKGISEQEQEVFGAIADARARMAGAANPNQVMGASRAMDSALGRLLLVVENYPNLRSSESFQKLQDELAGTENRIAVERKRYNDSVRNINVRVKRFPTVLYAQMLGFEERTYFEAVEGVETPPAVQFSDDDEA